ncbi:LLM class flavin-dependent oxidoreductase [Prescottella equi]|uniref:LLM class flavin-dependent oxidoreductase n=2 Tax=Rhodococcus hoagii TaxID=43767 RepID=A0A9Q2USM4_RHOHA|nr:LLM class flavin-dependent oxidoreductase [Prescottella equi]MBU4614353.1 LLM class flavin-dependent oxidoreductase [Rhodococcus sp. GG48]MBM4490976.1 LLM class flavin-dependent oxidoreductase [Prescottella equi]MBM4501932.1 LLM class flavin-dependent oxidoreductase [Prescottella equi]MBM4505695.1 LLM class flavin-dependent oxidoreductase [Prescottella equi]MBM4514953.1 LLM class flavin-dependent oxidoreductase [Prescottella equi]
MGRLRFGAFIAPHHAIGQNPTVALQRDLEFVEHLDRLDFDEVWIGEHHSAGSEIIGSPEIFIAAAAERTKRIKLGTGVTSLSYHNPLWVADRMVLLDHLTRGRVMLGVGPGSLPTDSAMIGLNPTECRELLEENLDIVVRLLHGESVTATTRTHTLIDAQLQLRPYSHPCFEVVVAGVASPTGPRLAGKHGLGLLSIGATLTPEGYDALGHHFGIMEERAAEFGTAVDRDQWRLVCPMHIAETEEQAQQDVRFGLGEWIDYFGKVAAFPHFGSGGAAMDDMIKYMNHSGMGIIGTPAQARELIDKLVTQSGGFGSMLIMNADWAAPAATKRSFELIAQQVAPHFQGQSQPLFDAAARAGQKRDGYNEAQHAAIAHMTKKYEDELAAKA